MAGFIPIDPEQMNFFQNVYLAQNKGPNSDKISLLSYQNDDTYSNRTSTPADLDYSPKRMAKPRVCTKHPSHTPEELEKCLELMEKNRVASLKSRRKKLTIIDEQKERIQNLETDLRRTRGILKRRDVEKNQLINENQQLKNMITTLQAQLTNFASHPVRDVASDVEIIDVEKIDDIKVTDSVENVSNMMESTNISQESNFFNPDWMNFIQKTTPEFYKEIHNILKVPVNNQQVAEQPPQAKPPLLIKSNTKIQYAPKPGVLNLDEDFEHNPAKYHSPCFQHIVYKFYGASPTKLVTPVPSTSKENPK
uniref:BZIP domain-containing protein n=1 Tax=Acrobeloides nanus TaxID=290746 RepID=A0A914EPU0_9BILA